MSGYQPQGYDPRRAQPAAPQQWQQQPRYPPAPYQPPYPQQYPPPGWQQPMQVAPKSTGVAVLLGLLPPCGIGCMYAGRAGIGVLLMAVWLLSIPLLFVVGIGFFTALGAWIASAVLGYTSAQAWNRERGIIS